MYAEEKQWLLQNSGTNYIFFNKLMEEKKKCILTDNSSYD